MRQMHPAQITRRRSFFAAAIGTAPILLAACGAPSSGAGGQAEPALGKTVKPGKFTFLNWWSAIPSRHEMMDEVARRWKERRPEIDVEFVAQSGTKGVREKFVTAQAAGDPYDSAFSSIIYGRDLYDAGQLLDLDRYIKRAPDVADDKFLKNSEQFRKAHGKTFGIPVMGPESNVIVINSNMFRAAGLDPQGKDIKTWDDLDRIAQQFTKREGQEVKVSGYLMNNLSLPGLAGWTNTTGSSLFNADQTKAFYTASGTASAMEHLSKLHNGLRVTVPVTQKGRPKSQDALLSGEAAMVDGISSIPSLWFKDAPPDFSFWQIPYPKGPSGKGPNSVTWINMVVFAKSARNPEQAFEFMRWFCGSAEVALMRLQMVNSVAPLRAFFESKEWQGRVRDLPVLRTIQQIAELPGVYPYRRYGEQNEEITPMLRDAFLGKEDIKNVLQKAQAIADRVLSS